MTLQKTVSPYDQTVAYTRQLSSTKVIGAVLDNARTAQVDWRRVTVAERQKVVLRWTEEMVLRGDQIGRELALQMGR